VKARIRGLKGEKRRLEPQSWNLMTGKNLLWVAKQHGQSVSMMLTYAAWTEGATDADVEAIKRAMEQRPRAAQIVLNANPQTPPEFGTGLALDAVRRRFPARTVTGFNATV
jgi:hypothetical protein